MQNMKLKCYVYIFVALNKSNVVILKINSNKELEYDVNID